MKHALRQLATKPGFTIVALLTLALGIGVNTTAFTVLNRLMLQALPFHGGQCGAGSRLHEREALRPRESPGGRSPARRPRNLEAG